VNLFIASVYVAMDGVAGVLTLFSHPEIESVVQVDIREKR
jgi:hypothetical protein